MLAAPLIGRQAKEKNCEAERKQNLGSLEPCAETKPFSRPKSAQKSTRNLQGAVDLEKFLRQLAAAEFAVDSSGVDGFYWSMVILKNSDVLPSSFDGSDLRNAYCSN